MANETISQLPSAVAISQVSDLIELSHYTGAPGTGYTSQRATPSQLLRSISLAAFTSGYFTLTPNATSTVVLIPGCASTSIMPCPLPITAHAAASMAGNYYILQSNQLTVNHASNTFTDRTFSFFLIY